MTSGNNSLVSHVSKSIPRIFDQILAHILRKVKETNSNKEIIHLEVLSKSAEDLSFNSYLDGDCVFKGGCVIVKNEKPVYFINYMDIETKTPIFMTNIAIIF